MPSKTKPKPRASPKWPRGLVTQSLDCQTMLYGILTPKRREVTRKEMTSETSMRSSLEEDRDLHEEK